jgi:hypothetical protein
VKAGRVRGGGCESRSRRFAGCTILRRRHRRREQEALHLVAAEARSASRCASVSTPSAITRSRSARAIETIAATSAASSSRGDVAHEGAVDLERVDRQPSQVASDE